MTMMERVTVSLTSAVRRRESLVFQQVGLPQK